ncbi:MAG: hypothetical protein ACJ0NM_00110 [Flavobacteriaceae bacterium]
MLDKIYKGNPVYLLLYIVCFLPFYTIFQVIIFNAFENIFIISLIKYSKDFVLLSSFILYIIGTRESFFNRGFKFSILDKLIISFLCIVLFYLFLPLGEATFISKVIYSKNIFLIGIVYFFGRNTDFKTYNWNRILKILIGLAIFSFLVALSEKTLENHLHSYLGFSEYNLIVNDIDPQGNYGLNWSFESQSTSPRYAAFFADPLEFSASLILFFTVSIWFLLHSKFRDNKFYYLLLVLIITGSFLLAISRASIFSAILVLILALYISKNYKTIISGSVFILLIFIYLYFFSEEETRYLLEDTLSFQNTSSLGHLVEWIEGLLSIYENPFGIGLAMSGNASGVDQSIKIGGENQFLIYGVQMGVISVLLYIIILFKSIWNSIRVYIKSSSLSKKSIGFITGLTKFGLLIPLFTANAELYLFVALFSWYLVGQVESLYNSLDLNNKLKIEKS